MKLAVVTISIGELYNKLSDITHKRMFDYASKIGADFIVLEEQDSRSTPHYKKLDIKKLFEEGYDRVLYVDTDILIRPDTPNIFDIVPETQLGIFNENAFVERTQQFIQFVQEIKYPKEQFKDWNGKYYNTGVMVISKQHSEDLFIEPETEYCHFYEQSYLNLLIHDKKIPVFDLPYQFNRMTCMEGVVAESRFASYFIHYAGAHYVLGDDNFIAQINKDSKTWDTDELDGFVYKKKFVLKISGGLGDVIAAEPAARYFCQKEFPEADIVILTPNPEVLMHLQKENVVVVKSGSVIEDLSERRVLDSLHTPSHPYFNFVIPLSSHQLSIASHLLMRYEIPLEDRTIRIHKTVSTLFDVVSKWGPMDNYVLIHPGKHWQSKTFPKDIWQSYIDTLLDNGYKVAVIGKRIDYTQGIVEGLDTSRCLDLVDKTTVSELVAIMDQAKVLISNDSSPIHMAGATDIHIGLIPTSKRPWCILPHRKGNISYKTKSLYKKPLWEDYPSNILQFTEVRVEKVKESRLRECLPDSQEVLDYVKECFNDK